MSDQEPLGKTDAKYMRMLWIELARLPVAERHEAIRRLKKTWVTDKERPS